MRPWPGLIAALFLAACAPVAKLPASPVAYGSTIAVDAEPVALDPRDPGRERIGNFRYAGGIAPTSPQTARLHGLSDLKVLPDGALLAASDQADLFQARPVLDAAGRLVGLADARITALKDARGVEVYAGGQRRWDSEAIAVLPDGSLLVAFEHDHRILLYPPGGGPPREVAKPDHPYRDNMGIEAMAAAPEVAPDAYRVGIQDTGRIFLCRPSLGCRPDSEVKLQDGLELTSMEAMPEGRTAYLLRSFSLLKGNVNKLRIVDGAGRIIDELTIARPLTTENFEGVGVVRGREGRIRFYLVSDDNFGVYEGKPTGQRTLLFAFDWTPPKGRNP